MVAEDAPPASTPAKRPLGAVLPPDQWIPDDSAELCGGCRREFGFFRRRHHCRHCGYIFCASCSEREYPLSVGGGERYRLRVCDRCFQQLAEAEAVQREGDDRTRERTRLAMLSELDLGRQCFEEAHDELRGMIERSELPRLGAPVAVAQIGTRGAVEKSFHVCKSTRPSEAAEPGSSGDAAGGSTAIVTVMRLPENSPMAPDSDASVGRLREYLLQMDHPFVHRTHDLAAAIDRTAIVLVREYWPLGSLKDRLHRLANPLQPAGTKYSPSERGPAWPFNLIRLLGRQILEGLKFLRSCGLPCACVHSGNVLMRSEEWCVVSEMELDLAGLEPISGVTVQMERPGPDGTTIVVPAAASAWVVGEKEPAVAAFGHILFEMLSGGRPLCNNTVPPTDTLPQGLVDAFELIFATENTPGTCRLQELLELPVFADLSLHQRHAARIVGGTQNGKTASLSLRRTLRKGLVGLQPESVRKLTRGKESQPAPRRQERSKKPKKAKLSIEDAPPREDDEDEENGPLLLEDGRLDTTAVQVRYPSGARAALARAPSPEPEEHEPARRRPPPSTVKLWLQRIIGGYEASGVVSQPKLNGKYFPAPPAVVVSGDNEEPIPEAGDSDAEQGKEPEASSEVVVVGSEAATGMRYLQAADAGSNPPMEIAWIPPTDDLPWSGRWDFRQGATGVSLATGPRYEHGNPEDGPPRTGWRIAPEGDSIAGGEGGVLELSALVKPISLDLYWDGLSDAGWDQLGDIVTMTEEDFLDAGVLEPRHRRLLVSLLRMLTNC